MRHSGTSYYRLALTTPQLEVLRCSHQWLVDLQDDPEDRLEVLGMNVDTCRCCSVLAGIHVAQRLGTLDWDVITGPHGNLARCTVTGPSGQLAITRLLAYVQGHREPLELIRQSAT